MSRNPSIFIRLPNLGPHKPTVQKWTVSDITGIIDDEDFGEIREVSVRFDSHGEQFAVIHFERWFRGAEETAELLYGGGEVKIGAKYGKHFVLRMFRMPVKPDAPRPRKTAKRDVPKPVAPKSVNKAPRPRPEPSEYHDYGRFASSVPNFLPPQPQQYMAATYYPTNTFAMVVERADVDMEEGEL